ncbi:MAE_28990/MAE_18760 family HEPN-like nuclease [Pectobacterium brasiliense]|uniref:MAE_28990/MAE_18760 family HEPN-like nuclease n=1 Tax=Pectobacterium brasiliense TaxID=180957 RepID=UPI0032F09A31
MSLNLESVKTDARKRFSEVYTYLTYVSSLEPTVPLSPANIEVKIMRGLFYVHLYSAIEKTVNEAIVATLSIIKSVNVKNKHLKTNFNAITLHPTLQSFKTCKSDKFFLKATDIFDGIDSLDVFPLNESMFSGYLQNIWYKTIEEIVNLFKLKCFSPESKAKLVIDEIVDKRNSVAHGRTSAAEVGQSHNSNILRDKMADAQTLVFLFVDVLEQYVSSKGFIRDEYRSIYSDM